MLKQAIIYAAALKPLFSIASLDLKNKYFTGYYWNFDMSIQENNYYKHQMVSIDKSDNIIGYFEVAIDRECRYVFDLKAIRFLKDSRYDICFAIDLKNFFLLMFDFYKYNKINFSVFADSPHEKMYDNFIKRYGGRIVGTYNNHGKLIDGTITDLKMYELESKDLKRKR